MNTFTYQNSRLHAEGTALQDIAQEVGTPFYCYSANFIRERYQKFENAFKDAGLKATICYSVKANSNQAVLAVLSSLGCGADIVSGGELQRALKAGIEPRKIVFSGVGKTYEELSEAIEADIQQINVESDAELIMVSEMAKKRGKTARVSIRVNPGVSATTHEKVATGNKDHKFGIFWKRDVAEIFDHIKQLPNIEVTGMSAHIGSQITNLDEFRAAFQRIGEEVEELRRDGHTVTHLDLGGGLGICYRGTETPITPEDFAAMVKETVGHLDCELMFEPGRYIVGNAGVLVSEVVVVKEEPDRPIFVVLDAAMNDLARPSLYNAYHDIKPLDQPNKKTSYLQNVDFVGPICETGDTFTTYRYNQDGRKVHEYRTTPAYDGGELVAIMSAGAYGAVMSGTYNTRSLIPEVMVDDDKWAVIRPRETVQQLIEKDQVPAWL